MLILENAITQLNRDSENFAFQGEVKIYITILSKANVLIKPAVQEEKN